MNQLVPARSGRKAFSGRRLALLASAAGLAIAVVATGTSGFSTQNFPGAIATAHADTMQRSTGFADIVEKVKPAVISVRVKIDATAKTTGMNDNDEANPMQPGAPLE
jgi:serine protease Do